MTAPRIIIAATGDRSGYLIAVMTPPDEYVIAARLVVGDVYRTSPDGQPGKWRAWLWPSAGGALHLTQNCEAVDAGTPGLLRDKLQKRADKSGAWWAA